MGSCTICGNVAIYGKTCVLCSYGRFPDETPRDIAKIRGDRHNSPSPGVYPEVWLEVLLRERVSDLFLTLAGLPGHWKAIDGEVKSTKKTAFFFHGDKTTELGRQIYRALGNAIVNAAADAGFDFPQHELVFNHDVGRLKIERVGGRLNVISQP